ncbi:MAG: ABC transporter ATP-binding protein [Chloroflexi bacterium]|nr:ABC transporter ATP-binding protein [Chloroflexota bacterium]
MIELTHVTKRYRDFIAVNDLTLTVNTGEIVGIIGHNGAGKSTTLKMIAGLVAPTEGAIRVLGRDIQKESVAVKRHIGFLPEESPLYENMTAHQYLVFFSELYGMPRRATLARIDALLDSLKLPERDKMTGEFSKGMKRKVAIARTLLHDPDLLVLDEPNSGLDPLTSFFIINYLKTLKRAGKTILLSAHNLFHVEYICDRVAIIKNGQLVVFDTMDAIRASLGRREYQVVFKADEPLDFEHKDDNYVFRTTDVGAIADMLETIAENEWALVDLSVQESALEEIYVKLMTA